MSTQIGRLPLFALIVATITLSTLAVPGPAQADGEVLDRRVNVALADSAPEEAFKGLATMIGLEAEVEPGLDDKITVQLDNVRMRTVLDAVCESVGCRWSVVGGNPAKLRIRPLAEQSAPKTTALKEPIDLRVTKANVRQVLQTFGAILGMEVELDPGITGQVTFDLRKVPVGEALDRVCDMAGCAWKLEDGANPVLRFTKE